MSSKSSDLDDTDNIGITLMTLRKPTELKKVIDTIPKPVRAIPKNGLPLWYRLGLECKLPVPKIPEGKIVFSRGRIGEDVRRIGLGGGPRPTFDLTDPYCYNVSYDYVAVHDPHLTHHFSQKPIRQRMVVLGYCTPDGRAKCSLKEFNQYRKYLYNQFMDRIHMEMKHLDERARDDLVLKRVDEDVARREQVFTKTERARRHLEMVEQENADELAEKRRLAKEREKKIKARIKYLAEFNEKQRKERALRSREKENRIKQRVRAAAELELRRKITMIRQWRDNESKRLNRLKQERENKQRMLEEEANNKWKARVDAQNYKIQEEALLLKIYSEDMKSAAMRRIRRAEVYAYNTDLELQRIRMANWKALHGGTTKAAYLVKKMGIEFEKSKRGSKGMSVQVAQRLADEAMTEAVSTQGDALMTLAQARHKMDIAIILPSPPVKLLDQMVEMAIIEFTRKCMNRSLLDIENTVRNKSSIEFFHRRADSLTKGKKVSRWSMQVAKEVPRPPVNAHSSYISFGEVTLIPPEHSIDGEIRSIKDRTPTPVPSKSTLVEVTFSDRVEDLPDPVALANHLPERKKLIETIHTAEKLLMRLVSSRVQNGMYAVTQKVTLPHMRHSIDWREAVVGLATAVVEGRVHMDCPELRQASDLLAYRVLHSLQLEARNQKEKQKNRSSSFDQPKDFYVPSQVAGE